MTGFWDAVGYFLLAGVLFLPVTWFVFYAFWGLLNWEEIVYPTRDRIWLEGEQPMEAKPEEWEQKAA